MTLGFAKMKSVGPAPWGHFGSVPSQITVCARPPPPSKNCARQAKIELQNKVAGPETLERISITVPPKK